MTILQSIILGVIQGLTEFLPISSSAHLVLVPYLLDWTIPPTTAYIFDVLVQVASLIAVIVYFRSDLYSLFRAVISDFRIRQPLKSSKSRLTWLIVLATIPAGVFGLIVKDQIEASFSSPIDTAKFLLLTSTILVIAELIGKRIRNLESLSWIDALWIGVFQALAVFPGVSRSGSTISAGMVRQLDRTAAARFSFLMSIPIMLAAGVLALKDLVQIQNINDYLAVIIVGFLTSAFVSYLSIRWLLRFLTKNSLYWFAAYCAALGLGVLSARFLKLL